MTAMASYTKVFVGIHHGYPKFGSYMRKGFFIVLKY